MTLRKLERRVVKVKSEEAFEVEALLNDLERYEYPFIKQKVTRIKEVFQPIFDNEKDKEFKRARNLKWSWAKFSPLSNCQITLSTLNGVNGFYQEAKNEVVAYERETQDILHAIELTDLSDSELMELMNRLREIRRYRRKAKDFIIVIEPLLHFSEQNKRMIKELGKVHKEIQSNITKLENRIYTPREITTLEEAFKQAGVTKKTDALTSDN